MITFPQIGQILNGAISAFIKQTTVATWQNEAEVLDRVGESIINIKEMFNVAVLDRKG